MLFNSWQFGIFFPFVFIFYWLLPNKFRWFLILASSYYFYMSWNVKYIVLILFTTIVSYIAAILIERFNNNNPAKKFILFIAVISCLGVLFVFKYFNFFSKTFTDFMKIFAINLHPVTLKLLLPVGISFYTFQTLSYVFDVYSGKIKPEKHFGIYAAFISFFPQLVAGPIERTNNLLPQIKAQHNFDYSQAVYGLKLMAWGYFKKLVVADNLAPEVDKIYAHLDSYQGFLLLISAAYFALQIYCDFSGYSDIARGAAKLMGIELIENFRSPYFSASIHEFWTRWHISLSTWFRDYVYIPLGGSRVKKFRHYINIMITFIISGLWHGANWTFILWGSIHGAAYVAEDIVSRGKRKEYHGFCWFIRVIFVFIFCVAAWVFFRAQNLNEVIYIFSHMFDGIENFWVWLKAPIKARRIFLFAGGAVGIYDFISVLKGREAIDMLADRNIIIRWFCYMLLGFAVIVFSQKGVAAEFVYFQF